MIREYLNFRIELVNPKEENESDQFAREFVHSFGLKTYSGTWSGIYLDSPVIRDFITKSKEVIGSGVAEFAGFCSIGQHIEEDENTNIEWYELESENYYRTEYCDGITAWKADKISPNIHIANGDGCNTYVSEKFKAVVEEQNLTGLEFLWVKDIGRYKAPQWFIPVIWNPLGRGLDHPWFNPDTIRGSGAGQPKSPEFRCGVNRFYAWQIKQEAGVSEIHKEILSLFNPDILNIISYKRFLREHVPQTDFTYIWEGEDQETLKNNIFRHRIMCISKKAKDALIANKLISDYQITPVMVMDKPPAGVEILDGKAPLPIPYFSCICDNYQILKDKTDREYTKFLSLKKPEKKVTFKKALKYLLEAKRLRPEDFNKALTKSELNRVNITLPENWIEVLKKSNGCNLNYDCTLVPLIEIEGFSKERQEYSEEIWEDYPKNLLHIAHGTDGDWYSLELNDESAVDCKVKRISHETCQPIREWHSISMFIFDMLTEYSQ